MTIIPVPPCSNIVRPEHCCGHVVECWARQAKVAYFELAVAICQDVLGLQVPVEDLGCRSKDTRGCEVTALVSQTSDAQAAWSSMQSIGLDRCKCAVLPGGSCAHSGH